MSVFQFPMLFPSEGVSLVGRVYRNVENLVDTRWPRSRGPKHLEWTDGDQIDFYDQPAQVTSALAVVDRHFRATLGAE